MSWLGSTARKGKPRPARTYRNRAGRTTVYTDAGIDSEGNQSDCDEHVTHKVLLKVLSGSMWMCHAVRFLNRVDFLILIVSK